MPPKKRSRTEETSQERERRLLQMRERAAARRDAETPEQREERLQTLRNRAAARRASETPQQHEERLQSVRTQTETRRASETPQQREERQQRDRDRAQLHNRTVEQAVSRRPRITALELRGLNYDPDEDYSQHRSVVIGKMDVLCAYCGAVRFKAEPNGICCKNGKVKLSQLQSPPQQLLSYTSGETPESKHFLKNIRRYNSCFQMTSFGATSIVEQPGFAPTFTVQGQVYHKAGSLLPSSDEEPKFLQLYFIQDEQRETDQRCSYISETRRDIVLTLQRMFHEHNGLIKMFKTSLENMPSDEFKVVIRADKKPVGEHERRFNVPEVNEVAVLISDEQFDRRDIVLQKRGGSLQRISETHRSYDSLQYPVMFTYGEDGYHFLLKQVDPRTGEPISKKISAMDFYAYRIMFRPNDHNHLLNCRQLFHQFLVDMYAKIESERLLFIRLNQKKLRVEEYIHLRDAVVNDGNTDNLGALVILPATFTGSPRHMHEYTQDAMTYVRNYGRPDLFITFTCNPTWSEIKELLTNGQKPNERHDLIARVFKQKQLKLINVITKSEVFGPTRCWMYSIEWQKRGLPHSHNLIWLKEKIQPTQIDQLISAEIPDERQDPTLFSVITKNMIHGPCGILNPNSPCMKDKKCTKKFPRQLISETQTGVDGYPLYRRRAPEDGGFTTKLKMRGNNEVEVDNSWVVPYSPLLSKMFQAHINVEYCNSVKSIKYICKYVNKGSDMAVFGIGNDNRNDEVSKFQLGRYISSNEAVWRILGFQIHERHPTVVHLSVHLENGQRVYFTAESASTVADQPPNTTLTAFFQLCQQDEFARTLFYHEVPKYYTWNTSRKVFCRRKIGERVPGQDIRASDALGRVYTVHPNNAECYFLRMLLHTVKGPRSFEDLRRVEDQVCETYREACQKLGLLEGDQHWDDTLKEAELFSLPEQIRNLFAIILTTCNPSNPSSLWEKYKEALSEDILAKVRRENPAVQVDFNADIFNEALIILEDKCVSMIGQTLHNLGLSTPVRNREDTLNADYVREMSYNIEELEAFIAEKKPLLNEDQKNAHQFIMEQVENQHGGIIFLDASGGTGKTFLTNLILAEVRAKGNIALAVASSGIAATLMEGGRTAHSSLKLPIDISRQENPTCNISKSSSRARLLKSCKLIVWDECTMAHKKSLEALDNTLKDLKGDKNLMGGALILLCGDFRQTLPVIPKSTPADEINACLKNSYLWKEVQKVTLRQNMRVHLGDSGAEDFSRKLLDIGEGKIEVQASGNIKLDPDLCNLVSSDVDLIQAVYPDVNRNYTNLNWLCERAILAAKNEDVHQMNTEILKKIPTEVKEYKAIDTAMDTEDSVNFPTEFLNSLQPPGLPPYCLQLKVGSPIILLRNLDPPKLCNGTRLCIKKMMNTVLQATILTGKGKGESVFIPRIPLCPSDLPFSFKRFQFPIRLAFSITINKSQGQSIKYCGLDLRSPCFSHGQLYVACSRVGSPSNLFILANRGETKNIVYKQVLC